MERLKVSKNFTAPNENDEMFDSCRDDLQIIGSNIATLCEATYKKTAITGEYDGRVYVIDEVTISDSLKNVITAQLPNASIVYETNGNLTETIADDVVYIGRIQMPMFY